ncbi:MAG: hypothetical protein J7621_03095 [Niastella sp.]|nr:hypothetical protein [Niastella sp.]
MKQSVILSFLLSCMFFSSTGQQTAFSKSDKLLNLGIGVNSYYQGGIPLGASFEVGVSEDISVGVSIDYLSYRYRFYGDYSYKFTALYAGARASYHFNELLEIDNEKIDVYGGGTLGLRSFRWKDTYSDESLSGRYGSGLYVGAYVGGKYYFNPRIGAMLEAGAIGSTNVRIGVGFKF